jgi:hypothetical protein
VAGDDKLKELFNNGGTLYPGVDFRLITIEYADMLVKEVGLGFLRASFFLILLSILIPKSWQGSEGEGLLL